MKLRTKAFTLIELLLVIVILAILVWIIFVAINPGQQVAQANNAQSVHFCHTITLFL